MWVSLPALIDQAMADDAVRVLMLRAAEAGAFCAGADIAEFAAGAGDPAWRAANQAAIADAQTSLSRAPLSHTARQAKAMVRRILDGQAHDDADTAALFTDAFALPDFAEGAAAFLGKRKPQF